MDTTINSGVRSTGVALNVTTNEKDEKCTVNCLDLVDLARPQDDNLINVYIDFTYICMCKTFLIMPLQRSLGESIMIHLHPQNRFMYLYRRLRKIYPHVYVECYEVSWSTSEAGTCRCACVPVHVVELLHT